MDGLLKERLEKISDQIKVLRKIEEIFLTIQAHEKVLYASLYLAQLEGSVEEKKNRAYSSTEWRDFSKGLATTEAQYLEQKRLYELKLKAYDAEHASYKIENQAIVRQK